MFSTVTRPLRGGTLRNALLGAARRRQHASITPRGSKRRANAEVSGSTVKSKVRGAAASNMSMEMLAGASLIGDHVRKGEMEDAEQMLATMRRLGCAPPVDVYNRIIQGYVRLDDADRAIAVLFRMRREQCSPTARTYELLVNACVRALSDRLTHVLDHMNEMKLPLRDVLFTSAAYVPCAAAQRLAEANDDAARRSGASGGGVRLSMGVVAQRVSDAQTTTAALKAAGSAEMFLGPTSATAPLVRGADEFGDALVRRVEAAQCDPRFLVKVTSASNTSRLSLLRGAALTSESTPHSFTATRDDSEHEEHLHAIASETSETAAAERAARLFERRRQQLLSSVRPFDDYDENEGFGGAPIAYDESLDDDGDDVDVIDELAASEVAEARDDEVDEQQQQHHVGGADADAHDLDELLRRRTLSQRSGAQHDDELDELPDEAQARAITDEELTDRYQTLYDRQVALEAQAVEVAVDRYKEQIRQVTNVGKGASLQPAQRVLLSWYEPLVEAIAAEQEAVAHVARPGARPNVYGSLAELERAIYGPYIVQLSPERLAVIAMHEVLGILLRTPDGVTFANIVTAVGRAVQSEVLLDAMRAHKERDERARYVWKWLQSAPITVHVVQRVKAVVGEQQWSASVVAKVGAALVQLLMDTAMVNDVPHADLTHDEESGGGDKLVPAFSHGYRVARNKRRGYLFAHPEVYRLVERGHRLRETMSARYLPMIVPPRDWTTFNSGGYLVASTNVMRTSGSHQQVEALKRADLSAVLEALNVLGRTAWRINERVYDVCMQAWESGGGVGDMPPREDKEIPVRPPEANESALAMSAHLRAVARANKLNAELHSLRCDLTYKLQVATEFRGRPFYFPHNMDFRGRVYPVPPHLNQLGSDICRGLLLFADKRPLGERGLRWLKIHLANLYGNNKMSFDERVAWTDAHLDAIRDSATNPWRGARWWLDAEDPWQCLATCFELNDALKCADPRMFLSNVPVHQDGTCNGLQHYAALGGDPLGAEAVNLIDGDAPRDVYSGVADIVARQVAEAAAAGNELAKLLDGNVSRRVVKQTVMTSVYGVTFYGARAQIRSRLAEIDTMPPESVAAAANYIAKLTFDALREMFLGARNIMTWLADTGRAVARDGHPITWTTPLGLPVVQPYRRAATRCVRTIVQTVVLAERHDQLPVNVLRQASAFPPNYIHSLDSTHCMLTAKACRAANITFASVHDSFWTHAGTVDEMAAVLRDEFVDLHSMPLLDHLRQSLLLKHPHLNLPPVPRRGEFDLRSVLSSKYFFS